MSEEFLTAVLSTLEKIVVGLIPVMLAWIAFLQMRYAAQQKERDQQQAKRVRRISKVAKQQTEKLDEAMNTRKEIAATQTKQIDDMAKSGPQPVTVENKNPIE